MRGPIQTLFVVLPLAFAPVALAQTPAESLSRWQYAAAEGCPSEADFIAQVFERLGRNPFSSRGELNGSVFIARDGESLVGQLQLSGVDNAPRGSRRLQTPLGHCQELAEALAIALAIAIDPLAGSQPNRDEVEATETDPAGGEPIAGEPPHSEVDDARIETTPAAEVFEDSPTPEAATENADQPSDERPVVLRFLAEARATGSVGSLPAPSMGGGVGVGIGYDRFELMLDGSFETLLGATEVGIDAIEATLLGLGLRGCGRLGPALGCIVVDASNIGARGPDLANPEIRSEWTARAGISVGFEAPDHWPVRLGALLTGYVPLARTSVTVSGETIWTAPPVSASLSVFARFDSAGAP